MAPCPVVNERPVEQDATLRKAWKPEIVWRSVIIISYLHIAGAIGVYAIFTSDNWKTIVLNVFHGTAGGIGLSAGAHRLWSHRSYKAKLPLRILLVLFQSMAVQTNIYEWCRDHRVHHKYSETDADPHNAKRGFFFSHMGWLLLRKHPDVKRKGKTIDLSDILADPLVRFQRRLHIPLSLFLGFVLPTVLPVWLWNETYWNSYHTTMYRYVYLLHATWIVNSAAHLYGHRPYDNKINPRENWLVSFICTGEGSHNFHHTFPWDYSSSEFGWILNLNTNFIDAMAWLGLAYDLKTASPELIEKKKKRVCQENAA